MNFKEMHYQAAPLLICNVWDAASARAAEGAGFSAIATSSYAIAGMLGYRDGEELTFDELYYIVRRIAAVTKLPFSVDIEAGYSRDAGGVIANIGRLAELGVVGVNIEDSRVDGSRGLVEAEAFAQTITAVKACLAKAGRDIFLNVRTDPFLLGHDNAREETIRRGQLYAQAGADGLFAPCIVKPEDIEAVVGAVRLPLNVLSLPQLPAFNALQALGVKRISMGNALFDRQQELLKARLLAVREVQSVAPMFASGAA